MKDELSRRADTTAAGQLNAAGGLAGSTNVPSGATLGSLGGFQFDGGAWAAPGVRIQGGASAFIAFGNPTPPNSASGTGVFIDQTGLYGLQNSVQQAVIDASGQLKLHAGLIVGNANGIGLGNPAPPTDQATGTGLFLNGNGMFGLRNSVQTLYIDTVTGSIKWTNAAYIGELQGYLDYTSSTTGLILGQWAVTQIGQGTWHGTGRIPTYSLDTPLTYGQWISIDPTFGIRIMNANKNLGRWKANGDFLIGTDLSAPATTNFIVFNAAQTYNTESVQAGDLLLGDNSAGKANLKWVKATGQLQFRGGQTSNIYIDTDGSEVLLEGASYTQSSSIRYVNPAGQNEGLLYGYTGSGFHNLVLAALNISGPTPATSELDFYCDSPANKFAKTFFQTTCNQGGGVDQVIANFYADQTNAYVNLSGIKGGSGPFDGVAIGAATQVVPAAMLDVRGNIAQVNDTNGQQLGINTLTELLTIAAAATTDTTLNIPANAIVLGVSVRVTVVIPTAATFTVTGATSGTGFNTGTNVSTAANTTDPGTKAGAFYNSAAQHVRITPNLTPANNSGRVRVTVHYLAVTPPTS